MLLDASGDDAAAAAVVVVGEFEELSKNRGIEDVSRSPDSCFTLVLVEDALDIVTPLPGMKG